MSEDRTKRSHRRWWWWWGGAVVGVALLAFVLWRIDYQPVPTLVDFQHMLVVLSDITAEVERARLEAQAKEVLNRPYLDRKGMFRWLALLHPPRAGGYRTRQRKHRQPSH